MLAPRRSARTGDHCVCAGHRFSRQQDVATGPDTFTIAGHTAEIRSELGVVITLLTVRTDHGQSTHITLRLNNNEPPAQLRSWAETIATAVLGR